MRVAGESPNTAYSLSKIPTSRPKVSESKSGSTSICRLLDSTIFQGTGRPTIPIQVSPGQVHRNQPIVRRLVVHAPNLCLTVLQAPPFEMTLQDAQGHAVTSAECCRPQSALFEFTHQPLDLCTASSLPVRNSLVCCHPRSSPKKPDNG